MNSPDERPVLSMPSGDRPGEWLQVVAALRTLGVLALLVAIPACGDPAKDDFVVATPKHSTVVDLGRATPWAVVSGFGSTWLQTIGDASGVTEVRGGKVEPVIRVEGEVAASIAVGAGSVWTPFTTRTQQTGYDLPEGEAHLARIDPADKRVTTTIDLGAGSAVDVVASEERVWVTVEIHDGPGRIVEVDPLVDRVVREIPLGTGAGPLALSGSTMWAATSGGFGKGYRLVRVDPATGRTTGTIECKAPIGALAASDDAVWAASGNVDEDGAIAKVDPETMTVVSSVDLPGQVGGDLGLDDGSVWVGVWSFDDNHFPRATAMAVEIDENSGAVSQALTLGDGITKGISVQGPRVVALTFDSVEEGLPTGRLLVLVA